MFGSVKPDPVAVADGCEAGKPFTTPSSWSDILAREAARVKRLMFTLRPDGHMFHQVGARFTLTTCFVLQGTARCVRRRLMLEPRPGGTYYTRRAAGISRHSSLWQLFWLVFTARCIAAASC